MRTMFSLAIESADSTDGISGAGTAPVDNNAGLLEGALEDHDGMVQTSDSVDELIDGQEKLEEVVDVASESFSEGGLSKRGLAILKLTVKNIVGKNLANRSLPAMESYGITHPMQVTAIALEGINDTIKQFWQAIKNQMGKFWNQTKSWYLKTFDVANKIIARAKALDEKANTLTTTPTEKSFEMGGASLLAVDYQVKDPAALLTGLNNMKAILDGSLDTLTKDNQARKSEALLTTSKNLLARLRSAQTKAESGVSITPEEKKGLDEAVNPDPNVYTVDNLVKTPVTEEGMKKKLGLDDQTLAFMSASLPGNRKLFRTEPANTNSQTTTVAEITEALKRSRHFLGESAEKPREMEDSADVKTLNSSQIGQIASVVGDMGETILKYKKEFEARDKFTSSVVKGFDQIIKELDGTEVEHPSDKKPAPPPSTTTNPAPAQPTPAPNPQGGGNGQASTTQQADGDEGDAANLKKPNEGVDKDIRRLANAFMQMFKKQISLSGAIITHSVKVCNVYLTYGERSLAQYGK